MHSVLTGARQLKFAWTEEIVIGKRKCPVVVVGNGGDGNGGGLGGGDNAAVAVP